MKPKTMILMVVAVTCGLGASYMTSRLLAERGATEVEQPTLKVLVAAKNLDMGLIIKNPQEVFQEKAFIQGEEPRTALVNYDDLKGRQLKRSLRAGDWVAPEDLLSDKDVGLNYVLAQGYRAIGLRVSIEAVAGGFASLPHSRVDIISTVRRGDDKNSFSHVLLENVLVLAVDQSAHRDQDGRAMPGNVVTVALKPEDVLKVNLAKEMGPLSLVLRKFNDNSSAEISRVTVEDILNKSAGRKDEIVDVEAAPETPTAGTPGLPKVPAVASKTQPKVAPKAEKVEPEVAPQPVGHVHRIRVIEGEKERVAEYLLDDNGQVIHQDVVRTELAPAAPAQPGPAFPPPVAPKAAPR